MELLIKLAALSLCVSAVTALLKKSDEALSLLLLLWRKAPPQRDRFASDP